MRARSIFESIAEFILCVAWPVVNDSTEMANKFNLHFSTIADKLRSMFPNVVSDLSKLRDFVNSKKVLMFTLYLCNNRCSGAKCTEIINQHKGTGIGKISARLLKIAAPAIAPIKCLTTN